MYWDKKIITQFEDIKDNNAFQKAVSLFRTRYGIPKGGYDLEELENEADLYFEMFDDIDSLLISLKRPHHLRAIVTSYIIRGVNYDKKKPQVSEMLGAYCYIDYYPKSGHVNLVISSGAKRVDVTKIIKKEWGNIEEFHKKYAEVPYLKGLKLKNNKSRDRNIYSLREISVLKSDGKFNLKKAKEYLSEQHVYKEDEDIYAMFKEIGINIPRNSDTVKMILGRFRKEKLAK